MSCRRQSRAVRTVKRIRTFEREGQWIARAEDEETGDPFGIETSGASEAAAVERLSNWLDWQRDHAEALQALQQAERAYHRTIAGSAFLRTTEDPSPIELQKESLDAVEAARIRLDEIRARKPE
jgi:hypothetical protein